MSTAIGTAPNTDLIGHVHRCDCETPELWHCQCADQICSAVGYVHSLNLRGSNLQWDATTKCSNWINIGLISDQNWVNLGVRIGSTLGQNWVGIRSILGSNLGRFLGQILRVRSGSISGSDSGPQFGNFE